MTLKVLRPVLVLALITGLLAGAVVALFGREHTSVVAHGAASSPAGDLPREGGPLRTAVPGVRSPTRTTPAVPGVWPDLPGSRARVVATAPDPYGGPAWAVRTFVRPNVLFLPGPRRVRRGTVECVQVGRMLRGRFVWIAPRSARARDVPVRTTDNTVCGGSGRRAIVGALRIPVGRPGASRPTIAATVVWGLSRRAGTNVRLRTREGVLALPDLGDGARLVVRPGDHAVGAARVVADGTPVDRGVDNQEFAVGTRGGNLGFALDGLRIDGVIADPSADRPRLLVTASRGGSRCWALTGSLVGGEPVRVVTSLGALAPSAVSCQTLSGVAAGRWTSAGGSAGSGGQQPSLDRRRARERRALPGYSASVVAVPTDVVSLDVRDDAGVRTVRTIPASNVRLAVVLSGGDLPMPSFGSVVRQPAPVYTGRTAAGRPVRLREGQPSGP
jgi:hypothetical protein